MLLTTNMRVTKYVILSPECTDVLPCDVSTMIYESKHGIVVKETCFGAIIEGEEDAIESLIKEIRGLDPSGIFVKDRGFLLGDPRRCLWLSVQIALDNIWQKERKRQARQLHDRGRVEDAALDLQSFGVYCQRRDFIK